MRASSVVTTSPGGSTRGPNASTSPQVRVVVVGPFNQGKSTLVNTIVGAPVCPVDDISMTAIPTIIEYGPAPSASLTFDVPGENRSANVPIDINDLRYARDGPRCTNRVTRRREGRGDPPGRPAPRGPGAGRHPRCRRGGCSPCRDDAGHAPVRGCAPRPLRRQPGADRARAQLPSPGVDDLPARAVRPEQDRPGSALARRGGSEPAASGVGRDRRHHPADLGEPVPHGARPRRHRPCRRLGDPAADRTTAARPPASRRDVAARGSGGGCRGR